MVLNGMYHITHKMEPQKMTSKQFLSKIPTEFQNLKRSIFMKEKKFKNLGVLNWGLKKE